MKTLFVIIGLACLGSSSHANPNRPYSPKLLLSDLPDGAVLVVPRKIWVELDSLNEQDVYFHTHFDNRTIQPHQHQGTWGQSWDSGVSIQTSNLDAIGNQFRTAFWGYEREEYLIPGRYCLSRSLSQFNSRDQVILSLHDCQNRSFQFNLYVQAGWRLRHSSHFHGLTLRDLADQVGNWLYFNQH